MERSAPTASAADRGELPPLDLATMRETALPLLDETAAQPAGEDLAQMTVLLRDHITQLLDEVATATQRLPERSPDRACAQACVTEARMHLRLSNGTAAASVKLARSVAVKLARSVKALCEHHENLTTPAAT